MKLRLTIANKISIGFGILLFFVIMTTVLTRRTLQKNLDQNREISGYYMPSFNAVNDLSLMITNSKILIINWVAESKNTQYKNQLKKLHETDYKKIEQRLDSLSYDWTTEDKAEYDSIKLTTYLLFEEHKKIMNVLKMPGDYNNPAAKLLAISNIKEGKTVMGLTDQILTRLAILSKSFNSQTGQSISKMDKSFKGFKQIIEWSGVILFFVILIMALSLTRTLIAPVNRIKKNIIQMSEGRIPDELIMERSDEIGEMGKSLNELIHGLRKITQFSNEIGKENYKSEFTPLSEEDELGNSLILMRENLKKASEEAEVRRAENYQRSWASQGLAEFGELLRESKEDLEELTNQILTRLVRYLDANIGGLFIINDDDKNDTYLELVAFYAYDRRKYVEKRINIGENLIGQCVLENETIFMNDIPKDYIHITSGTGKDNPKSLLIVPLKLNEEVYGVVELASFTDIEPYQIEFVEKIGESIASTISSAKININTAKLLQESNEKSERLTKQEEETRRQIEEMQKSMADIKMKEEIQNTEYQDLIDINNLEINKLRERNLEIGTEMKEVSVKYNNILAAVDNSLGSYSLSFSGEILDTNDLYLSLTGITLNEIKGRKLEDFMQENKIQSPEFQNFMSSLLSGRIYRKANQYFFNQKEKWFFETFTPLYDEDEKFSKIICLVTDITANVEKERELQNEMDKANETVKRLKDRML
ncbi:MAG: GAF domain-containing protein [Bacteroidota bacterium]